MLLKRTIFLQYQPCRRPTFHLSILRYNNGFPVPSPADYHVIGFQLIIINAKFVKRTLTLLRRMLLALKIKNET